MIRRPIPPEVAALHQVGVLIADVADMVRDLAEELDVQVLAASNLAASKRIENIHARAVLIAHSLRKIAEEAK